MKNTKYVLVFILSLLVIGQAAHAKPNYYSAYTSRSDSKSTVGCDLCHVNPAGGGVRNSGFGTSFESLKNGGQSAADAIEALVAEFPSKFKGASSDKEPVLSNVNFSLTGGDLTHTTGDTLQVTIDGVPDNLPEDRTVDFIIKIKKSLLKFVEFSTLEGEIVFDEEDNASVAEIELSPGTKLLSPKIQKKLEKLSAKGKGLKVKYLVNALDANGKKLKKEKAKGLANVTFDASEDEEPSEE